MLSLAIFVGFKRFARSAGFALRCVALRIRSGAPCMGMCVSQCASVLVCVLSIICFTELPTHAAHTLQRSSGALFALSLDLL